MGGSSQQSCWRVAWLPWMLAICLQLGVASAQTCQGNPPTVLNNIWNCKGTPSGALCVGKCNQGYGSTIPGPSAMCKSGEWDTPVGDCTKICDGAPDSSWLKGLGSWPASCEVTRTEKLCTAQCSAYGFATVRCGNGEWRQESLYGGCSTSPVCIGQPPPGLLNGYFPRSCASMAVGGTCTAVCNLGYGGPAAPTIKCVADSTSPAGAKWEAQAIGTCDKVCDGLPPDFLLRGLGSWPSSCDGKTKSNKVCTASCVELGTASIKCHGWEWGLETFTGGCLTTATCLGTPGAPLANGQFPSSCTGTLAGNVCPGDCLSGFSGYPTVACILDAASPSGARWQFTATGSCTRGGTALCTSKPTMSVANGQFPDNCEDTAPGGSCTARCNTGYAGAPTVACMADAGSPSGATWSQNVFGSCQKVAAVCKGTPSVFVPNGYFPATCTNTAVGSSCSGLCNPGYTGSPSVACQPDAASSTAASWATSFTGSCVPKTCPGSPPPNLLEGNGVWPSSCTDVTPFNGLCIALCDNGGVATIRCGPGGWDAATFTGECNQKPIPSPSPAPQPSPSPNPIPSPSPKPSPSPSPQPPPSPSPQPPPSPSPAPLPTPSPSPQLPPSPSPDPPPLPSPSPDPIPPSPSPVPVVCNGALPTVANGVFPGSCTGAAVSAICTATCNGGFTGAPISTCLDTGLWSDVSGKCTKSLTTGMAFMVSQGDDGAGAIVACFMDKDDKLTECKANNGAVGQAAGVPLNFPTGIATDGVRVWVSDKDARVRVCTFEGTTLTECRYTTSQTNGLMGAGSLAVDFTRGLLYAVLDQRGCVLVCRNIFVMDMKCPCYTFAPISSTNEYPVGLALGFDQLWVTSAAGVSRCPLTSAGFDFNRCTTTQIMHPDFPTVSYNSGGILVDTTGPGAVYLAGTFGDAGPPPIPPSVLVCNTALTTCVKSTGDGTFVTPSGSSAGPGYIGMALASGRLYLPLVVPPNHQIIICSNPTTVSGCKLTPYDTTRAGKDTVNVAVIPPPATTAALQIANGVALVEKDDLGVSTPVSVLRRSWRSGIIWGSALVRGEGSSGSPGPQPSSPQPGVIGEAVVSSGDAVGLGATGAAIQSVALDPSSNAAGTQPPAPQGGAASAQEAAAAAAGLVQPAVLDSSLSIDQLPGAVVLITRPWVSSTSLVSMPAGEVTEENMGDPVCSLGTGGLVAGP